MKKLIQFTLFIAVSLIVAQAHALFSPLGVSILPPVQFPSDDFSITGARVSAIWGRQRDVYGIDLGLVGNITDQDFGGVGVSGLFNITHGTTTAIVMQAAGVTNVNTNKTAVYGVQLAGGVNYNSAESKVVGLQIGLLANVSDHTNIYGAQLGLYNSAQSVYGLQIGLVNFASDLHGVQIGLVNFNHNGPFAVSPIINVGF